MSELKENEYKEFLETVIENELANSEAKKILENRGCNICVTVPNRLKEYQNKYFNEFGENYVPKQENIMKYVKHL